MSFDITRDFLLAYLMLLRHGLWRIILSKIVLACIISRLHWCNFLTFHFSGRFARFRLKVSCLHKSGRTAHSVNVARCCRRAARRAITAPTGVWWAATSVHRSVDAGVARLATSRRRSTCTTCWFGRSGTRLDEGASRRSCGDR